MITDAFYVEGKVALRFFQPIPKYVQVGGKSYVFDVRNGISLIFVPEEEVPPLLGVLGGCCGQKRPIISLATEVQYSHWLNGQGGR